MTPPPSRPIGAVLFDLDGTLVDTEPAWMAAESRLAQEHGVEWTAADAEALVGSDLWDGARYFIERGVPMGEQEIVDRLVGEVLAWMDDVLPARPGALELLGALRDERVPVALVTMSTRSIVDRVEAAFARSLGGPPFDATVAGDECERGKPDPEPYRRGLELLGVAAEDAVAIEDSRTGAASALAAGLVTIGVPHAVDLHGVPGLVHWPSLAGRTPADLAAAIAEASA